MESVRISRLLLALDAGLIALGFWGVGGFWQEIYTHNIKGKGDTSLTPTATNGGDAV